MEAHDGADVDAPAFMVSPAPTNELVASSPTVILDK
jgi:hypothetical protein